MLSSSAQAHDLYVSPLGVHDVDAMRTPPCLGTHDSSPGMVGHQHHRSPFEQIERHWKSLLWQAPHCHLSFYRKQCKGLLRAANQRQLGAPLASLAGTTTPSRWYKHTRLDIEEAHRTRREHHYLSHSSWARSQPDISHMTDVEVWISRC